MSVVAAVTARWWDGHRTHLRLDRARYPLLPADPHHHDRLAVHPLWIWSDGDELAVPSAAETVTVPVRQLAHSVVTR